MDEYLKEKNKELLEENKDLKLKLESMQLAKEYNLITLMGILTELDTVGILHGGGSKQRAKDKLILFLKDNYGPNYKAQLKRVIIKFKH